MDCTLKTVLDIFGHGSPVDLGLVTVEGFRRMAVNGGD